MTLKTLASFARHRLVSPTATVLSPTSGQAIRGGGHGGREFPEGSADAAAPRWGTAMQLWHWKLQNVDVDAMGGIILFV